MIRRYLQSPIAEFLGTLLFGLLTGMLLLNVGTPGYIPLYTPLVLALAFGSLAYVLGIGLNPVLTLAWLVTRRITPKRSLAAFVAQFLGGWFGLTLARLWSDGRYLPQSASNGWAAFALELIGAFFFVLLACRPTGRGRQEMALLAGLGLMCGMTIALPLTGGTLNPFLAFVIGSRQPAYLLAPLLGGVLGAFAANLLAAPTDL